LDFGKTVVLLCINLWFVSLYVDRESIPKAATFEPQQKVWTEEESTSSTSQRWSWV